jgi:hypothetical protein
MNRQAWKVTVMAILTAAAFSTVQAAPEGKIDSGVKEGRGAKMKELMLKRFDADGDGVLSDTDKAAMAAARKEMITKYDTDGDGVLSETERAAIPKPAKGSNPGKTKTNPSVEE